MTAGNDKSADQGKSQEVLKGHKRVGKRYIPPMVQLGLNEVSYVNQLLPEIVWIGLINDRLGYEEGIDLSQRLAQTAKDIHKTDKYVNFAFCSSYRVLTASEKKQLVEKLGSTSDLTNLQSCLAPLTVLYEGFPLIYLGLATDTPDKAILLERLKYCIERHINKYGIQGMAIQTCVVYIRGITGGLHIPKDIEVPDLNAIFTDPDSEKARRAAGFVRATVLTEITPDREGYDNSWSRSFWNQGVIIDGCKFED